MSNRPTPDQPRPVSNSSAADAAAAYLGRPAPLYLCPSCDRRPQWDGRCGC